MSFLQNLQDAGLSKNEREKVQAQRNQKEHLKNQRDQVQAQRDQVQAQRETIELQREANAEARKTNESLNELNETNQQIAETSKRIASLQEEHLHTAKIGLGVAREQLSQLRLQTEYMHESLVFARRERALRNVAFAVVKRIESVRTEPSSVARFIVLDALAARVNKSGVDSLKVDALADKVYIEGMLQRLSESWKIARAELNHDDFKNVNEVGSIISEISTARNNAASLNKKLDAVSATTERSAKSHEILEAECQALRAQCKNASKEALLKFWQVKPIFVWLKTRKAVALAEQNLVSSNESLRQVKDVLANTNRELKLNGEQIRSLESKYESLLSGYPESVRQSLAECEVI